MTLKQAFSVNVNKPFICVIQHIEYPSERTMCYVCDYDYYYLVDFSIQFTSFRVCFSFFFFFERKAPKASYLFAVKRTLDKYNSFVWKLWSIIDKQRKTTMKILSDGKQSHQSPATKVFHFDCYLYSINSNRRCCYSILRLVNLTVIISFSLSLSHCFSHPHDI